MKRFENVLIVGGSGMLAGLARTLCDHADRVSVLGRNEKRIRAISGRIEPIACDYNDGVALSEALSQIAAPDLVVAWIHGRAPHARRAFAECLVADGRFVHVLGSAHADPAHPERLAEKQKPVEGLPIDYQAVVLGFVVETPKSRWLTNAEIANGVFAAIASEAPHTVIGTVEPWSAKP
jgi:NADPH:quinone reductase-like Zn-dependent oxidoreductase